MLLIYMVLLNQNRKTEYLLQELILRRGIHLQVGEGIKFKTVSNNQKSNEANTCPQHIQGLTIKQSDNVKSFQ